jgi:hypothetical protein
MLQRDFMLRSNLVSFSLKSPRCVISSRFILFKQEIIYGHVRWVPVTTAWRVLRLRMEETPYSFGGQLQIY